MPTIDKNELPCQRGQSGARSSSAERSRTISSAEYLKLVAASKRKGRNKYGAKPTGGHASKKEHGRAVELRLMHRAGLISNLREQVRYELIPNYYLDGVLLERACYYIADFVYEDADGNTVVEDTKGVRTKEYIIKLKLMLKVHGIQIKEI